MRRNRHKFNAITTEVDDILFHSQLEAEYYKHLKLLVMAKEVVFFLRQVPFHLPGKTTYRVDFQVFYTDETVGFIDVKGVETKEFIRAKKQVEALYPVEIEVIKKGQF